MIKAMKQKKEKTYINTYEENRNKIKTGDIILFSGESTFSKTIRLISRSKWSHVAIVLSVGEPEMKLCFESVAGAGHLEDYFSGELKAGVHVVSLSGKVEGYHGEVAYRSLNHPVSSEMYAKLLSFRKTHREKKYDWNPIEMIEAAEDRNLFENTEDLSAFFCSELVAEAFQEIGLFDHVTPSNEYTPKDFAQLTDLNCDYKFGEIIELKKEVKQCVK